MQAGEEILDVTISSSVPAGLLTFEVQTGCLLSEAKHVLLCSSEELAEELNSMSEAEGLQDIVRDLSFVLNATSTVDYEAARSLPKRCETEAS